jgi:[ribosomal protein S5]-alanine N-acetyltransferase
MQSDTFYTIADFSEIRTERLIIRKFRRDDADDVFTFGSRQEIAEYEPWNPLESRKDAVRILEFNEIKYSEDREFDLALYHQSDRRVIGVIGFPHIDYEHGWGEIGFLVSPAYWNRNIATEAVLAFSAHAFGPMKLHRLEAVCMTENAGSNRVLQKSGFIFETIVHERYFARGRHHDARLYYRLKVTL